MNADFHRTQTVSMQMVTAFRAALMFLFLCGFVYTGIATLMGGLLFPWQSTGSLIEQNGQVIGSSVVGQRFVSPEYFYGRPSAADYDPMATGGSNLAPSNPELRERVLHESLRIQMLEGVDADEVPVDLLAASGAGLDPHISPEAARIQLPRVAAVRGLDPDIVLQAIEQNTYGPQWGVFGQQRVNVLQLNLTLDNQKITAE